MNMMRRSLQLTEHDDTSVKERDARFVLGHVWSRSSCPGIVALAEVGHAGFPSKMDAACRATATSSFTSTRLGAADAIAVWMSRRRCPR